MNLLKKNVFTPFVMVHYLGYFIGGIGPIMMLIVFEELSNQDLLEEGPHKFFFGAMILGFVPVVLLKLTDYYVALRPIVMLVQAFFSIIVIHLLVLCTGGPQSSAFALSYLYLPAIVGYCYSRDLLRLLGAAAFLLISCVFNLFAYDWQHSYIQNLLSQNSHLEPAYIGTVSPMQNGELLYFLVFLVQLVVTTFVARTRPLAS